VGNGTWVHGLMLNRVQHVWKMRGKRDAKIQSDHYRGGE
jgi:hypothetical protein